MLITNNHLKEELSIKNIKKIIYSVCIICCIFITKFIYVHKINNVNAHKNFNNIDLNLNKNLKLKGTPEDFIVNMPLSMKKDIVKNSKQFVKGVVLTDSKNHRNKNFDVYSVIYNDLNNEKKNRKNIYVYYNWSNIPRVLFKYNDNLQISIDNNCIIVPKSWLEIHTIYKDADCYKTFKNTNVKDLSVTNIEWDTLMNKLDILSIKGNNHIYGYRKVLIEKTQNNNNPIEINISYSHVPSINCKSKLLLE